jgi:hypothetical protein
MGDDGVDERSRAEDILLGSVGFGEDARIVSVERTDAGYCGIGKFSDGESFKFEYGEDLDDLQIWALQVLQAGAP